MVRFLISKQSVYMFITIAPLLVNLITALRSNFAQTKSYQPIIQWQAHRGGGAYDAPDNTMAAFYYTWSLGGILEADIRTAKDSVLICLHDATLARTTTAPEPIASQKVNTLTFEEIRRWDAGVKFNADYLGEKVPSLAEVFQAMQHHPERQMYLDLKDLNLHTLGLMIDSYDVGKQILIASPRQDDCKLLKMLVKGVRTMLWIGGTADEIKLKFSQALAREFDGLDQVQLHLNDKKNAQRWRYELEPEMLKTALQQTQKAGCDLEVFVKQFIESDIHALLDLGIRWYATDEPRRFVAAITSWQKAD